MHTYTPSPEFLAIYRDALLRHWRGFLSDARSRGDEANVMAALDELARLTVEGPDADQIAALADKTDTPRRFVARQIIFEHIQAVKHERGR